MGGFLTRKSLEIHVSKSLNLETEMLCKLLTLAEKQIETAVKAIKKSGQDIDSLNSVDFVYKKQYKVEIKFRNTYARMEISEFHG